MELGRSRSAPPLLHDAGLLSTTPRLSSNFSCINFFNSKSIASSLTLKPGAAYHTTETDRVPPPTLKAAPPSSPLVPFSSDDINKQRLASLDPNSLFYPPLSEFAPIPSSTTNRVCFLTTLFIERHLLRKLQYTTFHALSRGVTLCFSQPS